MIYYDGKIYRNLEEQVLKNQKDIEIYSAGGNFDLKGIVDGFDDLPESPQEGDYYLVGTGAPYDLYLYYYNSWINLGEYPKEGPQGPQGIAGQNGATGPRGPQGPKGDSLVYEILDIVASTSDLPDPDSVDYWDAYLVGAGIPYMAYFVIDGEWTPVGYITPQEAENVVTADSANSSSYKLMMSAQSGTRKIVESAWGMTSSVVDVANLVPSSQAVISYVQGQVSAAVKFKGTKTFAQLSALASAAVGDLYNISDAFTLSGVSYNAGTNLVCITAFSSVITPSNTYWDAYGESAIDLSPYMKTYTGDATQWDTTPTTASTKPVTSGGIKSAIDTASSNAHNYADTKTNSYILSYLTTGNSAFNSTADTLTFEYESSFTTVDSDDIGFQDLKLGDLIFVVETDASNRFVEAMDGEYVYLNKLETASGGGGGGIQNTATGTGSIAISSDDSATATGSNSVGVGKIKSSGGGSIYIGQNNSSSSASGGSQIAIGNSFDVGNKTSAIAIGGSTIVNANYGVAIGSCAKAAGQYSVAIGPGTTNEGAWAYQENNIVVGHKSYARQAKDIAIGYNISTSLSSGNSNNVVIGSFTNQSDLSTTGSYGVVIGTGPAKSMDHNYAVVFNRCKFIPMTKSDSYTLAATMHGMLFTSSGTTYYAPSSTVTTGASESALLICWYTD